MNSLPPPWRCALLIVPLVAALCGDAGAAGRPRYGGQLRAPLATTPATTNPLLAWTYAELTAGAALHEPLLRAGSDGAAPVPNALAVLPRVSGSGRQVELRLRPGLAFHDGAPVTAGDLAATLTALADPATGSPWRGLLPGLQAVNVTSTGSVTLHFDPPLSRVVERLAAPVLAPLPLAEVRARHPKGAGPFRRTSERAGLLELEAAERHWMGRPYLDRLTLAPVAPGREQQVALRLGRLGASFSAPRARGAEPPAARGPDTLVALGLRGPDALGLAPWLLAELDARTLRRFSPHPASAAPRAAPAPPAPGRPSVAGRLELRVRADRADLRAMAEAVMVVLLDLGVQVTVRTLDPTEQLSALLSRRPGVDLVEWLEPGPAKGGPPPGLAALLGGDAAVLPLLSVRRRLWLTTGVTDVSFSHWAVPRYDNARRAPGARR